MGAGNSTNKKDAEKNASKDFVSFLVRAGKIPESSVPNEGNEQAPPSFGQGGQVNNSVDQESFGGNAGPSGGNQYQSGRNFGNSGGNLSNFSPNQLGQAYRPAGNDFGPQSYMDRAQQQANMEEAESLDVNAGIHGNWTIENAKSKLNQFMQAQKIQGEFKYNSVGPDHNR